MVERIVSVPVRDVQADEIWGFCYKKEKERRESEKGKRVFQAVWR
jgi:hypothetical protein